MSRSFDELDPARPKWHSAAAISVKRIDGNRVLEIVHFSFGIFI